MSSREIACVDPADCIEHEQIAANDTIASDFLEEAICPRYPPAARSRRTAVEEPERQPYRAARGGLAVAGRGEFIDFISDQEANRAAADLGGAV